MIEPTDEMIEAVRAATGCSTHGCHTCTTNAVTAASAVLALVERDRVTPLRELLAQLVDEDPCWLDHHGYCQAHSLDPPPCPHQVVKELL